MSAGMRRIHKHVAIGAVVLLIAAVLWILWIFVFASARP